jgi:hypothetical protein
MNSTKTHLRVVDHCGPVCVSENNGAKMCFLVHDALEHGSATYDFEGVEILTPAFLNSAVSCLYGGAYNLDHVDKNVEYVGLNDDNRKLLEVVIAGARRFLFASAEDRASIVEATTRPLTTCK